MVFQSSLSPHIILDRLPQNSWARTAARQTGSNSLFPLLLFLLSSPASLHSLVWSVYLCTALFAHFVIISSDLQIYNHRQLYDRMQADHSHPLLMWLPIKVWIVAGTLGFALALIMSIERCWSSAIRRRSTHLPLISRLARAYLIAFFALYYIDRAISLLYINRSLSLSDILYPIFFLCAIFLAATYRHLTLLCTSNSSSPVPETSSKKTQ